MLTFYKLDVYSLSVVKFCKNFEESFRKNIRNPAEHGIMTDNSFALILVFKNQGKWIIKQ
jgi:hypothetical protein